MGKIINVVENNGVKSTYKIDFGIKSLDGRSHSSDNTEIVICKNYEGDLVDLKNANKDDDTFKDINASTFLRQISLIGDAKDNILIAGSGGSRLSSGDKYGGQDSFYCGRGVDVILWDSRYSGDPTVYNYTKKKDIIEMTAGEIGSYRAVGNDVILRNGVYALIIKDVKPEDIFVRKTGQSNSADNSWMNMEKFSQGVSYNENKVILAGNFMHDFYLGDYKDAPKDIDVSNVRRTIFIEGDERNNMIVTGFMGMYIDGLGGDDAIHCSPQSDIIYWGSDRGNDTIHGYSRDDIICLRNHNDEIEGYRRNGDDLILKCGESKLTVKNVRPEEIKIEYMDGSKNNSWREKELSE